MSELNFQSFNFDLSGFDLNLGFDELIPDMFQEASLVPHMSSEVSPFPDSYENVSGMHMSDELKPEECDWSNYHYPAQLEQQQQLQQQSHLYQHAFESSTVPSAATSPVQFGFETFNSNPTNYEEPQCIETKYVNGRKRRAPDHPCAVAQDTDATFQKGDEQNESKPKRKRVQNARQRKEANVRERNRMFQLSDAFDSLKTKVPTFSYEKRLSRMETLKLAMSYISFMTQLLDGEKSEQISLKEDELNSFSIDDLRGLTSAIPSSYVSDDTESSESGSISS